MQSRRIGNRIKLPSSIAIKHQLLMMMFSDEIRALSPGQAFKADESPALSMLRQLRASPGARPLPANA